MSTISDLAKAAAGRCWDGYEPVPGKDAYSDDSCRKIGSKKKKKSEKEAAEKQANLANIIKALKTLGKRTALFGGTGLAGYGIGRSHGFDSGQESIKDMSLKEIMDVAMPKIEVAKKASAIQELEKEADSGHDAAIGGAVGVGAGGATGFLEQLLENKKTLAKDNAFWDQWLKNKPDEDIVGELGTRSWRSKEPIVEQNLLRRGGFRKAMG